MSRLLFTGASGFLGSIVRPILEKTYDIHSIGLADKDEIKINLAEVEPPLSLRYDVVLHAAGKAHTIPRTEAEKKVFYDVNYQGTVNLCAGLEKAGVPESFIFISTVAVYGCDVGEGIRETHPLHGTSPYAKSKIMAEEYLSEWCAKRGVILGIMRPSLLAGQYAPGNLGAMVEGIKKGRYFNIDGGKARKSILMAEDVARLTPLLAKHGGVYNVCDSKHPSFKELSESVARQLNKKTPLSIPYGIAWSAAKIGDLLGARAPIDSNKLAKMTKSLTFSNEKARRELEWEPLDVLTNYRI